MTLRGAVALIAAFVVAACTPMGKPVLSAGDADVLAHLQAYLNGLSRFEAHFVQSGSFGEGAGLVWLDRPGHLRIDYAGPGGRVMVIAGGRVRVLDRATGSTTTMPVSRTPLGLLLGPSITLSGDAHVESLSQSPGQARLVLTRASQPALGTLTLDFSTSPLRLEAVSVTDPYHRVLTLQLNGIDVAPVITPELFVPPVS